MPLLPLTLQAEIAEAYRAYEQALHAGGQPLTRSLGWHGGGEGDLQLHWHPRHALWVCTRPIENRYWCAFGTSEPREGTSLSIVCEINIPFERVNRRVAGVFARDEAGRVCLLHSGKVGGGKAGVGKEAFWEYFSEGRRVTVRWPDGQETPHILLGRLDDADLLERIAEFVRLVERFKQQVDGADAPDFEEEAVLTAGALRFDGVQYWYRYGFDFHAIVRRFLVTGLWPEDRLLQLATLSVLHKFLNKWGGESLPKHGGYWRALRSLFLNAYTYSIPIEFRNDYFFDQWERQVAPRLLDAVAVVRRAHETTHYDDGAGPELFVYPQT